MSSRFEASDVEKAGRLTWSVADPAALGRVQMSLSMLENSHEEMFRILTQAAIEMVGLRPAEANFEVADGMPSVPLT